MVVLHLPLGGDHGGSVVSITHRQEEAVVVVLRLHTYDQAASSSLVLVVGRLDEIWYIGTVSLVLRVNTIN